MAMAAVGCCLWDAHLKAFAVCISRGSGVGSMELLCCGHKSVPEFKKSDSNSLIWLGTNPITLQTTAKEHLRKQNMLPADEQLEAQMRAVVEWEQGFKWGRSTSHPSGPSGA